MSVTVFDSEHTVYIYIYIFLHTLIVSVSYLWNTDCKYYFFLNANIRTNPTMDCKILQLFMVGDKHKVKRILMFSPCSFKSVPHDT